MTVAVEICNDALNHLGAEPINDLADDNNIARTCNRQYPIARDYILRQHLWNFAIQRDQITSSGTSTIFGEAFKYIVPANSVRIYKVVDGDWKPIRYKVEKGIIYANPALKFDLPSEPPVADPSINLIYIDKTTAEDLFDPTFKKAVAAQLAADMTYKITQSTTLMSGLVALAKDYVAEARSTDSMEGEPQDMKFDYFDNARRSSHEIYPDADFF
jgi:hypothetical protein